MHTQPSAAPASLIEALIQALDLYAAEELGPAQIRFEEVARCALPAAPDVWLHATYGIAECQRLRLDLASASVHYGRVLQRAGTVTGAPGRLAEANRIAVIQSFLATAEIGRLSLRVPSSLIESLLEQGYLWASRDVSPSEARACFRLTSLLHSRNVLGPERILEPLRAFTLELRHTRSRWCPIDETLAGLRLTETRLDLALTDTLSPPPPRHWAGRWVTAMHGLLDARSSLLRALPEQALPRLAALRAQPRCFETYPELRWELGGLEVAAHTNLGATSRLRAAFREQIRVGIDRATRNLGDLARPLWQHLQLMLRALDPGASRDELRQDACFLRDTLRSLPFLAGVLASRNLPPDDWRQLLLWCNNAVPPFTSSWCDDGRELLSRIARGVRP